MTAQELLKTSLGMSDMIMNAYLGDLAGPELLVRAVPGTNHTAWQLGHLIGSENEMMTKAGVPMPDLPAGFATAHDKEASSSDDAGSFKTKDEYLALRSQQRSATLAAIDAATADELNKPTPEEMQAYAKTVGEAFNMIAIHEMMHAPQLIAIRRKLDKPIVI